MMIKLCYIQTEAGDRRTQDSSRLQRDTPTNREEEGEHHHHHHHQQQHHPQPRHHHHQPRHHHHQPRQQEQEEEQEEQQQDGIRPQWPIAQYKGTTFFLNTVFTIL